MWSAGDIILIGATTENPSFEVNAALLSRSKVYALRALTVTKIVALLRRALKTGRGLGDLQLTATTICWNRLPSSQTATRVRLTTRWKSRRRPRRTGSALSQQAVEDALQRKILLYDKSGEEHYNLISALHKSVRSSDPDAALYWLARMLEAGEDRMYIARRDGAHGDRRHRAWPIRARSNSASRRMQAVHFLGIPEGDLALAQAAIYLSVAPKSDASYRALGEAVREVRKTVAEPVPMQLRNAPTQIDEGVGLRRGLPACARIRGCRERNGMPARFASRAGVLQTLGPRHGEAH